MTCVFADTSYYQALLNQRDRWHNAAIDVSGSYRGRVVTSEYVLCELGALLSQVQTRAIFVELVRALRASPQVEIVPASREVFDAGLELFASRLDKAWSLTDCISFSIMSGRDIQEALAYDRHFSQAGFRLLLGGA